MAPHCIHAVANTERIRQLENQVKALMFTQKVDLRDLQTKFDGAQTRIRQLELEVDRYKLERDIYYKKAGERLNRCRKESGLPTLSPSQLGSDPQVAAGGTELPGQPEERSSPERNLSREPVS